MPQNKQRQKGDACSLVILVAVLMVVKVGWGSRAKVTYSKSNSRSSSSSMNETTTTTTTTTTIIIAFKGAIRDFLQFSHSAANCLQHVRSSGPGATVCKSRATHRALITCKCHVMCHLVRRDTSAIKFDRVEIAFI